MRPIKIEDLEKLRRKMINDNPVMKTPSLRNARFILSLVNILIKTGGR